MSASLQNLCRAFVQRARAQKYKSRQRDNAAIEYFVGVLSYLHLTGQTDEYDALAAWVAMVLSVRGWSEIVRVAEREE